MQWAPEAGGNGHYYEIVENSGLAFSDALAEAAGRSHLGMDGHLATLDLLAEDAFVTTLYEYGHKYWIALSDAEVEGEFVWVAGPEAGYAPTETNWSPGEPNGYDDEDFVMAGWRGALWNDGDGDWEGISGFVVEYSAVPLPPAIAALAAALAGLAGLRRRKFALVRTRGGRR